MCRNIRTLYKFEPPATGEEIHASALQFVRKLSGFRRPSKANEAAFNLAVEQVARAAQLRLWPELAQTPEEFTLYGGTAIALQLGHRPSLDFDFFAWRPFAPNNLMQKIPYLRGATARHAAPDTLTVTVDRGGPTQLSFFGGLDLGQVARADTAIGPGIKVASLIDLAGFKVAVVT